MRSLLVLLLLTSPTLALAQPAEPGTKQRLHWEWDDGEESDDVDHRDRVIIGDDLVIREGERVRDAVVIGGDLRVFGKVERDAVAVGGDIILESGSSVGRDAVGVGGEMKIAEGVSVGRDKVSVGGPFAGIAQWATGLARGDVGPGTLFALGVIGTILRALMLLLVGLLVITFAPERVRRIRDYMVARPGPSAGAGFALLIGFIPLCVLLAITVIGIPFILVAIAALALVLAMGITALMLWVGERLPLGGPAKTPAKAMLLGLVIVVLVDLVPGIGTPVVVLAAYFAAGAVLLTRLGASGPQTKQTAPLPA